MSRTDLEPAATEMKRLVNGVRDDQLGDPTPCDDWRLSQLIDHVHEFTTVFTLNASKSPIGERTFRVDEKLPDAWRTQLADGLDALVVAWHDDDAWTGRVSAGGIEMPAEVNALVAVEELVVHGWDLARASGQDFNAADSSLDGVDGFFEAFAEPIAAGEGPYTAPVEVPDQASRLDRLLGAAGRDPGWRPA